MSSTPVRVEPARRVRSRLVLRGAEALILGIAAVFLVLHWVHLKADFPNHTEWAGDWAKYTDEGWYGDAAIRTLQLGHWNVRGDFNPGAALPVWPLLEFVVFRFTGVSVVAARALAVSVFGLILVAAYVLLRRWTVDSSLRVAPALGVLLLAVSPFCYVFMRLAILEPMMVLLTLLAMLTASRPSRRGAVVLGLLLPLMALTKTTAAFLMPSVFWMLWASSGFRLRAFARVAIPAVLIAAAAWGAYFGLLVRPRYLADYRYLFSANSYTGVTAGTFTSVLESALIDGAWIGSVLYPLALVALAVTAVRVAFDGVRAHTLPIALALWCAGYFAFLVYHDNLQPRYYLSIAVPSTLLVALGFNDLLAFTLRRPHRAPALLATTTAAAIALAASIAFDARTTIDFVRHPEYTFLNAAEQVKRTILQEQSDGTSHSPLVLSISGSDLSLITGLPSICDDFGTMDLSQRVRTYRPGWFVAWNDVEDDKMEALAPLYRLQRIAAYPAFDDPERNLMILYRLDPIGSPAILH